MADDSGFTERFEEFSQRVTHAVGRPWAFFIALLVIIIWAVSHSLEEAERLHGEESGG
jgi:low affinity Fe/Cu permease